MPGGPNQKPFKVLEGSNFLNLFVEFYKGNWNKHMGWTKCTQIKTFNEMRNLNWVHGTFPTDMAKQLGYVSALKQPYLPDRTLLTPKGVNQLFIELKNKGIII
ncbi:MAG: hypothetical protein H8D97_00350 [Proteobacteria bacterium]|nr:hypothetical protein [Pseudomonadota bacterium]